MRTRTAFPRALGAFLISLPLVVSGPVARSQPLAPVVPQGSALLPSAAPVPSAPGAPPCHPSPFPPVYSFYVPPGYRGFSLSLLPSTLAYEEGQPIPLGYELKTRATRRLLIMGAVGFSATYLPSAIAGGAVANVADYVGWGEPLLIPLAGPFVAVGVAHTKGLFTLTLILDGLVQTAGAAIFIAGLVTEETIVTRVRNKSFSLPAPALLVGPGSAALRWQF